MNSRQNANYQCKIKSNNSAESPKNFMLQNAKWHNPVRKTRYYMKFSANKMAANQFKMC